VATPFVVDGKEIVCTVSVGIAITRDGEREADGIVHAADLAMHEAKRGGKGRFSVYKPGMRRAVMKRLELKSELRRAIERQQLVVHYQPIMALQQGTMVGVEALVRWNHPERGLVPPSEFISAAEETGMIEPLGRWVLEEACQQTRAWQRRHPSGTPLWVSVNISPRQLAGSGSVDGVSRALAVSRLDPASLVVELTESVIAGDVDQLVAQFEALKALGVRIAIDDFGTGYSALASLRRLPLDIVKIDKQLVDDLVDGTEQADLVGTIVRLGRMLDLDVIAGGIENREQVERLTELRCALGQGSHYSPPLTSEGIEVLLARGDHVDAAVA
jgi:EAL domain-containing protein (putative c-di-GMP-specific phosphodiesterase class I)